MSQFHLEHKHSIPNVPSIHFAGETFKFCPLKVLVQNRLRELLWLDSKGVAARKPPHGVFCLFIIITQQLHEALWKCASLHIFVRIRVRVILLIGKVGSRSTDVRETNIIVSLFRLIVRWLLTGLTIFMVFRFLYACCDSCERRGALTLITVSKHTTDSNLRHG